MKTNDSTLDAGGVALACNNLVPLIICTSSSTP